MNDKLFSHTKAQKLEDPERLVWLPPSEVIAALAVAEGMNVADIGAGTGYFSLPLAEAIGTSGHVFASDVQQEMLRFLDEKVRAKNINNISLHHGDASGVPLPDHTADVVFLANVWHELDDHEAVLRESHRLLRAHGTIAILDWRKDVAPPPGPAQQHRIAGSTVLDSLIAHHWLDCRSCRVGRYSYLVTGRV